MLTKGLQNLQGIKKIFNAEQMKGKKLIKVENIFHINLPELIPFRPLMETLVAYNRCYYIRWGKSSHIWHNYTGTFFSFLTALLMAYQPIKSLASLNATLQMAMAAAERIFNIIETRPLITEKVAIKIIF